VPQLVLQQQHEHHDNEHGAANHDDHYHSAHDNYHHPTDNYNDSPDHQQHAAEFPGEPIDDHDADYHHNDHPNAHHASEYAGQRRHLPDDQRLRLQRREQQRHQGLR
jgi:hypothetical protein